MTAGRPRSVLVTHPESCPREGPRGSLVPSYTMSTNPNRTGLTLAELLVAIIMLGLLATILVPSLRRARRTDQLNTCRNNLSQLQKMASIYASMRSCRGPRWSNRTGSAFWLHLNTTRPQLIEDSAIDIFFCPLSRSKVTRGKTDYLGPSRRLWVVESSRIVGCDRRSNHAPYFPGHGFGVRKSGAVEEFRDHAYWIAQQTCQP